MTDTDVDIDEGGIDDVPAVVGLWLDLATEQRSHGSRVLADPNETALREEIGRHAVSGELFVARGGSVVGFVTVGMEQGRYRKDARVGVVKALYVVPDRRNEGIGTALLERAEAELAAREAAVVRLEALADNDAARRFYRDSGYHPHRVVFEKPVESEGESDNDSREAE